MCSKSFVRETQHHARADRGGEIRLRYAERAVDKAEHTRQYGIADNQRGVALQKSVVDNLPIDQGIDDADAGIQNHNSKKKRQKAGIGNRESHHALRRPGLHFLFHYRCVLHQGAHRSHHSCRSHKSWSCSIGWWHRLQPVTIAILRVFP